MDKLVILFSSKKFKAPPSRFKKTLPPINSVILHPRQDSTLLISVSTIDKARLVSFNIQDTSTSRLDINCSNTELIRLVFIYGLLTASYHTTSPPNLPMPYFKNTSLCIYHISTSTRTVDIFINQKNTH